MDTAEDEARRSSSSDEPLALIYIGSAENDFEGVGRTFPLPAAPIRVRFGRGDALDVRARGSDLAATIPLAWASGAHCELEVRATSHGTTQLWLHDLGSRNGTLLGGRRVEGEALLELGGVFEVGRSFWAVRQQSSCGAAVDEGAKVMPPCRHVGPALEKVARSDLPVLIVGQTGTGKESIAHAIHERSGRSGAFVHVGVSAFRADQLDEELGQGSRRSPGAARRGRGGTVYLADVGGLDARSQAALLAVLERMPAGGQGVRVVAGSDRELRKSAGQGQFRAELYSRLAGFEIRLPSLRECPEDIGLLVRQLGCDGERPRIRLSTPALRYLLGHPWPFNREQLHACLETASMLPSMETAIGEQVVRDALRGARRTSLSSDDGAPLEKPIKH
jgi:hypothetical protein